MVKVFLRNDDVCTADKKFIIFNRILIKNRVPVHHSVIPKLVSEDSAEKLVELKLRNPEVIEYGQHGYSHKNYGNDRMKFEFGNRGYSQQRRDIENGKGIMEKLFGRYFFPAFTPPYHRYDEDTLKALDSLGFKIFSARKGTKFDMSVYNFSFVPVSVSLDTNLAFAIKSFRQAKKNTSSIGIYTHHNTFGTRSLKNLTLFIKYLVKENVEFCKLSEMGGKNEDMYNIL